MEAIKKILIAMLGMYCSIALAEQQQSPIGSLVDMTKLPNDELFYVVNNKGEASILSKNGRFAIMGDFKIVDLWRQKKVEGFKDVEKLNLIPMDKFKSNIDHMSHFKLGTGSKTAYVFTDLSFFGNGELFSQFTPKILKQYTIVVLYYPTIKNKMAFKINDLVACSLKPSEAVNDAFIHAASQEKLINELNAIGRESKCTTKALSNTSVMASILGVKRVPTVINSKGEMMISPKKLEAFLSHE